MAKKVSSKRQKLIQSTPKSKSTGRKTNSKAKVKTPLKEKVKVKLEKTPTSKTKAIKKSAKKKSKPSGPLGYTEAQYQKFKDEKIRLSNLSNQALKEMLRKNLQSMSGNKDDLILKVADGIVLGRIPRCPNCFGGRPRYDYKTGMYSCPGYRDDQDYKFCNKSFTKEQLKRGPWE